MIKRTLKLGLVLLTLVALGEILLPAAFSATDGATLYTNNCEGCHGANGIGTSIAPNIKGVSAADIHDAINSVTVMSSLSSLSTTDMQAIASFLSSTQNPTHTSNDHSDTEGDSNTNDD
ncbi:Cytochrome C oxidase, cbb3-type, subunit III [uncultured archaeon]|nr:Cytochrome C oxidase, cbb3-type, subunit III [uncultured archaeon]